MLRSLVGSEMCIRDRKKTLNGEIGAVGEDAATACNENATSVAEPAGEPTIGSERLGVLVRGVVELANGCKLVLAQGSIVPFQGDAIVNAANNGGIGGGGVDGAVCRAGGRALDEARRALSIIAPSRFPQRIATGDAVTTIGGELAASWAIHAVGPIYGRQFEWDKNDAELRSAYLKSLEQAIEKECCTVAFSLLSAGIFRGAKPLVKVLQIGCEAISEGALAPLREVYMVGFTPVEVQTLLDASVLMGKSVEDKLDILVDEWMQQQDGVLLQTECDRIAQLMRVSINRLDLTEWSEIGVEQVKEHMRGWDEEWLDHLYLQYHTANSSSSSEAEPEAIDSDKLESLLRDYTMHTHIGALRRVSFGRLVSFERLPTDGDSKIRIQVCFTECTEAGRMIGEDALESERTVVVTDYFSIQSTEFTAPQLSLAECVGVTERLQLQ
eukprot:TRINITY_DN2122_c0_g1_i7.p1 TRINITY_DN2122_c0_g1~~TRINITY_DN2122_c0_g1_i7.p1  ORF type:complete len:441 (-),score=123.18 TRINITY_DN2122_c0_g1_i7:392-1714(-)